MSALVHLARRAEQGPIVIGKIAEQESIPRKFLEAILLELKRAGILGSKKGKGGGYYLLKSPDEVKLVEVMRLLDGPIALLPCVSLNFYERCEECRDEAICGIRDVFLNVRDETLRILGASTLSGIIAREDELKSGMERGNPLRQ